MVLEERQERERLRAQRLAVIAHAQAALTARCVLEGSIGEAYEYFPFWTEGEIREQKLEKYRNLLESMALNGKSTANLSQKPEHSPQDAAAGAQGADNGPDGRKELTQ